MKTYFKLKFWKDFIKLSFHWRDVKEAWQDAWVINDDEFQKELDEITNK